MLNTTVDIKNIGIPPKDYTALNNVSCLNSEELLETVKSYCNDASSQKPILFIGVSIFFSIIEYFIILWALKDPQEKLIHKRFNRVFHVTLTRTDVWVQVAIMKYLFLIFAIIYLILGVNIYG